jgi:hypothetical protein
MWHYQEPRPGILDYTVRYQNHKPLTIDITQTTTSAHQAPQTPRAVIRSSPPLTRSPSSTDRRRALIDHKALGALLRGDGRDQSLGSDPGHPRRCFRWGNPSRPTPVRIMREALGTPRQAPSIGQWAKIESHGWWEMAWILERYRRSLILWGAVNRHWATVEGHKADERWQMRLVRLKDQPSMVCDKRYMLASQLPLRVGD